MRQEVVAEVRLQFVGPPRRRQQGSRFRGRWAGHRAFERGRADPHWVTEDERGLPATICCNPCQVALAETRQHDHGRCVGVDEGTEAPYRAIPRPRELMIAGSLAEDAPTLTIATLSDVVTDLNAGRIADTNRRD